MDRPQHGAVGAQAEAGVVAADVETDERARPQPRRHGELGVDEAVFRLRSPVFRGILRKSGMKHERLRTR